MDAPQNPAGEHVLAADAASRPGLVNRIASLPARLRTAVEGLREEQLDAVYRNWTIRQIVHHLADSHLHAFIRFRLALAEETPTIKPYDESVTATLPDCRTAPLAASLALLDGLHARWIQMMASMGEADFARAYFHPEKGRNVPLAEAVSTYAWHGDHHTAQIRWLRDQRGW